MNVTLRLADPWPSPYPSYIISRICVKSVYTRKPNPSIWSSGFKASDGNTRIILMQQDRHPVSSISSRLRRPSHRVCRGKCLMLSEDFSNYSFFFSFILFRWLLYTNWTTKGADLKCRKKRNNNNNTTRIMGIVVCKKQTKKEKNILFTALFLLSLFCHTNSLWN